MMILIIYASLIILILLGLFGMFFCSDNLKKMACLSASYSSFVVLITLIALKNLLLNQVLTILVSIFMVFAINLLIGTNIAKKIAANKI